MTATNPEGSSGATPAISGVFPDLNADLFGAIRSAGHRRLALQVPAGLLRNAAELGDRLARETGARVQLVARACFGACDLPGRDEAPGADAAVVLGHAPIPNMPLPMPTYFVEMRHAGGDPEALAETIARAGLRSPLGIVASIQHLDLVPRLAESLARRGIELRTGTGDRRLAYPAQALGCNYTTAESVASGVTGFLFLGTGAFHPRGLALAVDRPVWPLDPLQGILDPPLDRQKIINERLLLVASARDARRWGILVSSFAGQHRGAMAESLRRQAEAAGREATILLFGRLDPADLEGRALDAYVNTACPRIATDDARLYPKPVLTPPEFRMALGEQPLEPYRFDTYH